MTETRVPYNARRREDDEDQEAQTAYRAVECIFGPDGWGRIEFVIKDGKVTHYRIVHEYKR